jgi:hypothetical protein
MKSQKAVEFISKMHDFIVHHPQLRKNTAGKSETQIQTEIRPLIITYLERYFEKAGYSDYVAKAHKSFYWEGQEGKYGKERATIFGSRNYPDFIVTEPYLVAIEYKQSPNGSTVKQGFGQSLMHTLSGDFDFVYLLFQDQSKEKRIEASAKKEPENSMIKQLWNDFNVYLEFI